MPHGFRTFLITSMFVAIASAHAGEAPRSAKPDGLSENGLSVNGIRKNGIQLNGIQLNGMSLTRLAFNGTQARTQLSGIPLESVGIR